ncbi:MAG: hypothetical protein ABSC61_11250 [Anaerolineales bacterium]
MTKPGLLLMDEPSLGLAPLMAREIFRVSGRLRQRGTTILVVEQNAHAALALVTGLTLWKRAGWCWRGNPPTSACKKRIWERLCSFNVGRVGRVIFAAVSRPQSIWETGGLDTGFALLDHL